MAKNIRTSFIAIFCYLLFMFNSFVQASKLIECRVVDEKFVMLKFLDGEMYYVDNGKGPFAFRGHTFEIDNDSMIVHGLPLDIQNAILGSSYTISSSEDLNYSSGTVHPKNVFRKTKMHAMDLAGDSADYWLYDYAHEHTLYLEMPHVLKNGATYNIKINNSTNTDHAEISFFYDNFENITEALHINLAGFDNTGSKKTADLYMWMGDGGARDYSDYEGNNAYLFNTHTNDTLLIGQVGYWAGNKTDFGSYNLIQSDVWAVDFSHITMSGDYRLVIDGIGCSQEFSIKESAYFDPYSISVLGYFYMRVGQDSTGGIRPVPRRPLFIPGVSPENTVVYVTSMHPFHPDWSGGGDRWDQAQFFGKYILPGAPKNDNAFGGHADAYDWDRHLGHVSNIYDLLLPYFVTNGALDDDNFGIAESGNGIPDILDEVMYEVDFWLRLRYKKGYSHGLSNHLYHHNVKAAHALETDSSKINTLYQAGNTAIAAWANALNCAMLSNCFMINGSTGLMQRYLDSALVAYNYAGNLDNQMLDYKQSLGESIVRGRDLKMCTAAFLYNVTGDTKYEKVLAQESVCTTPNSHIDNFGNGNSLNQLWGTAAYLLTNRPVHYQKLYNNMKTSVLHHAWEKEAKYSTIRASRRGSSSKTTYFKSAQNMQRSILAHVISDNPDDAKKFEDALILEAGWGLGRNPLNHIEMTTATTTLAGKRNTDDIFTTGHNDGTPGLHPGHTPYLNTEDWFCNHVAGCPSVITGQCFPDYSDWPQAEGYFPTRYMWSHSEFTPRQTMRGKNALYGYLYGLNKMRQSKNDFVKFASHSENGNVSPMDATYRKNTEVIIEATPNPGYHFSNWGGDFSSTNNPDTLFLDSNIIVQAFFELNQVYTLTVENGEGSGSYPAESIVQISAGEAEYGYQFRKWTGDTGFISNPQSANASITMPYEDILLTATYKEQPKYSLSVINGSGSGEYYKNDTVYITADTTGGKEFLQWIGYTFYMNDVSKSHTYLIMPDKDFEIEAVNTIVDNVDFPRLTTIKTFPNPVLDSVLHIDGGNLKAKYRIFDLNGKLMQRGSRNGSSQILLNGLQKGSYIYIEQNHYSVFILH
jgi:endoglucanase